MAIVDSMGKILLRILRIPLSSVNIYEKKIIQIVAPECKVMVDVGARTDIVFAKLKQTNCKVFLIEGNPYFYFILKVKCFFSFFFLGGGSKIKASAINAFVSPYDSDTTDYFGQSQSLFQNVMLPNDKSKKIKVRQTRLDTFLFSQNISSVDFIKFDIEGGDYFGLLSLGDFLYKLKYLQFELGVAKSWNGMEITSQMYINLLKPYFDLYLIRDNLNPFFSSASKNIDLIKLDEKAMIAVDKSQDKFFGFNCFAVAKNLHCPLPGGLIFSTL